MRLLWVRAGVVVFSLALLTGCSWFASILPASRGSVTSLRRDLGDLEGRVGGVERRLSEQQVTLERLEKTAIQLRDDVQAISEAQQAATAKLDQAGKDLQGMRTRIERLERVAR